MCLRSSARCVLLLNDENTVIGPDTASGRAEAHIFYDWCHIGRAIDDSEIVVLTTREPRCQFRADMYYLLKQQMRQKNNKSGKMRVVPLLVAPRSDSDFFTN